MRGAPSGGADLPPERREGGTPTVRPRWLVADWLSRSPVPLRKEPTE